jgi:hypothetical protein
MLFLIISIVAIIGLIILVFYNNFNVKQTKIKNKLTSKSLVQKPSVYQLTDYYKDIKLQPYGCFNQLDEKFFKKELNIYTNQYDSLVIINDTTADKDIKELVAKVLDNGYNIYAFDILHKYDSMKDGYQKISIEEIGTLGKLAGYNYLSVCKINENKRGKIYLSYSPPMDELANGKLTKSVNYTLTPVLNKYTNELEKAPGKELSCGYPCTPDGKPETFNDNGVIKQYMCGSAGFPTIKTPSRFAVYKIVETI